MREVMIQFSSSDEDAVELLRRLRDDISGLTADIDVHLVLPDGTMQEPSELVFPSEGDDPNSFRIAFDTNPRTLSNSTIRSVSIFDELNRFVDKLFEIYTESGEFFESRTAEELDATWPSWRELVVNCEHCEAELGDDDPGSPIRIDGKDWSLCNQCYVDSMENMNDEEHAAHSRAPFIRL